MNRNQSQGQGPDPQKPATPFGGLDNKSLESQADEVKAASKDDTDAAPQDGVKVKMLHHDRYDGDDLLPGREYTLPAGVAASLVSGRRAVRVTGDA